MKLITGGILINLIRILVPCEGRREGLTKRFISSWDFSNENNWKDGNTPCSGRKVTFRSQPEFPVFVGRETSLKSVDFLSDVTLIFGRESSLVFQPNSDTSCKETGTDSVFENKAKGYWWDPDSWKCEKTSECSSAVPDVHRVPCESDSIQIPNANDSVFRIIFTDPIPTVKSLQLGQKNVSTAKFYEFATSEEGRERIIKRYSRGIEAPLYVESEGSCTDITGCSCHSSTPVNEICRHMKWKCPKTTCTSPIYINGFCCKMCGVEVVITHNGSLAIRVVQNLLERVLETSQGSGVDGYAAKMPDSLIHVYFFPQHDWIDYKEAFFLFTQLFERDLNRNGIYVVQSYVAEGTIAEKLQSQRDYTSRTLATIFSIFFIILGVTFSIYLYRKRRVNELPFMFRRMSYRCMSTRSSRSTSIPAIPSSLHVDDLRTSEGHSFTNPSFGKSQNDPTTSLSRQTSLTSILEVECPTQRENPLYKIQMKEGISFSTLKHDTVEESEEGPYSETKENLDEVVPNEEVQNEPLINISETIIQLEDDESEGDTTIKEMESTKADNLQQENEEEEEDPLELLAKSRIENANKNEVKEKNEKEEDRDGAFDEMEKEDFGVESLISDEDLEK